MCSVTVHFKVQCNSALYNVQCTVQWSAVYTVHCSLLKLQEYSGDLWELPGAGRGEMLMEGKQLEFTPLHSVTWAALARLQIWMRWQMQIGLYLDLIFWELTIPIIFFYGNFHILDEKNGRKKVSGQKWNNAGAICASYLILVFFIDFFRPFWIFFFLEIYNLQTKLLKGIQYATFCC